MRSIFNQYEATQKKYNLSTNLLPHIYMRDNFFVNFDENTTTVIDLKLANSARHRFNNGTSE